MKRLILLFSLVGLIAYSCNKGPETINTESNYRTTSAKTTDWDYWSLSCNGSCECVLEGIIDLEDPDYGYVQCKCAQCEMVMITNGVNQIEDPELFFDSFDNSLLLLHYLAEYIDDKYGTGIFYLSSIEFYNGEEEGEYYVHFDYITDDEDVGTVLMAIVNGEGGKEKWTISCEGTSCECRERFNFQSKSAECTCNPCTLTVTHEVLEE